MFCRRSHILSFLFASQPSFTSWASTRNLQYNWNYYGIDASILVTYVTHQSNEHHQDFPHDFFGHINMWCLFIAHTEATWFMPSLIEIFMFLFQYTVQYKKTFNVQMYRIRRQYNSASLLSSKSRLPNNIHSFWSCSLWNRSGITRVVRSESSTEYPIFM